jgi:hypothetical protein
MFAIFWKVEKKTLQFVWDNLHKYRFFELSLSFWLFGCYDSLILEAFFLAERRKGAVM